jgi:hypothetical protein
MYVGGNPYALMISMLPSHKTGTVTAGKTFLITHPLYRRFFAAER